LARNVARDDAHQGQREQGEKASNQHG
jgi:hypothetical protein